MKCKVRRDMRDEKHVRMKDGRSGISGMCTACGGKIFRMVGAAGRLAGYTTKYMQIDLIRLSSCCTNYM
jgi:hypothetical protein